MFKKIALFGTAFTVALAAAAFLGASPSEAKHKWGNYHWGRTSNPLMLQLGNNVSAGWTTYLTDASVKWSISNVLDTSIVQGQGGAQCSPTLGRIEVCSGNFGATGWLGVAQIWLGFGTGTHILQATTKVNDYYHDQEPYSQAAWRDYVMCQEIGHDFGLGHVNEIHNNANTGSCMDYTNDPDGGAGGGSPTDAPNTDPNQHDYDQLAKIYGHLDGYNTSTAAGGSGRNNGIAVARDHINEHGLPAWASPAIGDVYITDLGNGRQLVVHVLWIPGGLPGAIP